MGLIKKIVWLGTTIGVGTVIAIAGKKINDKETILKELRRRRKAKDRYLELNDCSSTPYMDGANKELDELIDFVEKL